MESKHNFTVKPQKRYGNRGTRGYTIRISPPIEYPSADGQDVEGIGWVPHRGPKTTERIHETGWFKFKVDALENALKYKQGHYFMECSCKLCKPNQPETPKPNLDIVG